MTHDPDLARVRRRPRQRRRRAVVDLEHHLVLVAVEADGDDLRRWRVQGKAAAFVMPDATGQLASGGRLTAPLVSGRPVILTLCVPLMYVCPVCGWNEHVSPVPTYASFQLKFLDARLRRGEQHAN